MRSKEEVEQDFIETLIKTVDVQEGQDLTCSCIDCYWNYTQSNNQCISESLNEFKMTPNSLACKGYWKL